MKRHQISVDEFIGYKTSIRIAGHHCEDVNKALDMVVYYDGMGGMDKLYEISCNHIGIGRYSNLMDAINDYNDL